MIFKAFMWRVCHEDDLRSLLISRSCFSPAPLVAEAETSSRLFIKKGLGRCSGEWYDTIQGL